MKNHRALAAAINAYKKEIPLPLKLCYELEEGLVVVIICDRGDRYLSSGLF